MDQDTPQIRELSQKLFATITRKRRSADDLHRLFPPDLAADPAIGFVHRKTADADIYFLVNTSNLPVHSQSRRFGRTA